MNNVLALAHKELRSYFASPIGYVITGLFAVLFGWIFYAYLSYFVRSSEQMMMGGGAPNVNQQMISSLPNDVTEGIHTLAPSPAEGTSAFDRVKRIVGTDNPDPYTCQIYDQINLVLMAMAAGNDATGQGIHDNIRKVSQGGGDRAPQQQPNRPPQEKVMPAKSEKIANRNDKVSVQYTDGKVIRDVKYKKVEDDILNNRCVIID